MTTVVLPDHTVVALPTARRCPRCEGVLVEVWRLVPNPQGGVQLVQAICCACAGPGV